MQDLFSQLQNVLANPALQGVEQKLNVSQADWRKIASAAVPVLTGALQRNAQTPQGANALLAALDKDHDGSVLDDIAGYVQQGGRADAAGILKHILGDRQADIEQKLASMTGVDREKVGGAMQFIAPMVMGALGKAKREGALDAQGVSSVLQTRENSNIMSFVTNMLDSDGDGSAVDEVLAMGMQALGSFWKK